MNKYRNPFDEAPKKGVGNRETSGGSIERTQDPTNLATANKAREESNEVEEKSSNGDNKEFEEAISDPKGKDQDEGTLMTKEGESIDQSEEEPESEEEEEEGEIEISTPRLTKTKGRKSKKEEREQDTYKDKLQGSQLTLEKLLKNTRNTRHQGHAQKGMPSISKSK